MSKIIYVTEDNMPDISSGKILLDFFAGFCGPCKMISPYLDSISEERSDITIIKIDVEQNLSLTKQYSVRNIPALFVLKDGEVKATKVGGTTKGDIVKLIESVL